MAKNIALAVLAAAVLVLGAIAIEKAPLGASSGPTHFNQEKFLAGASFGAETNTPISARSCTSVTYNPPSLATNATATTGFSLPGSVLGDTLAVSFATSTQGITFNAYANTAASTTVLLVNPGLGATIDLATSTLKVCYTH